MKIKLNEFISYVPKSDEPLSAEVFEILTDCGLWVYDVGASDEAASELNSLNGFNVALSHFHRDHAGNIGRIKYSSLYGGPYTCKKFGGSAITSPVVFDGGVKLFPIPSSHSKGCLGLEYCGFAFLGDSLYSCNKDGRAAYSVGTLRETINALSDLKAENFILSHAEPLVVSKREAVDGLERIYALRKKGEGL